MNRVFIYLCVSLFTYIFTGNRLSAQATNKIDSTGDVGIGVLIPWEKLSLPYFGKISFGASTLYNFNLYKAGSGDLYTYFDSRDDVSASAVYFRMRTGGTPVNTLSLLGSGKVGVGITGPMTRLTVKESLGNKAFTIVDENEDERFTIGQQASYSGNYLSSTNIDLKFQTYNSSGTGGNFVFETGSGSSSEKIRINQNGNLGIGTSDPANAKLVVQHAMGSPAIAFLDGGGSERFLMGQQSGYTGNYFNSKNIDLKFQTYLSGGTGGNFIFETGSGSSAEKIRITADGRMGIGTDDPSQKLSVNGTILAKKLTVTQLASDWVDYVFDKKYKLRSLASLEQFIKNNKHLPEIPSAKEVEKNGISVGDNQALLLKKIEELTLYVIELKKENKIQQKQINQLIKLKR